MRKHKLTREGLQIALTLKKGGATNKDIAAAIGVTEQTFYDWVSTPSNELQSELSESLKKAEADYKNALLAIIAKASQDRDWKAAAWLLERKYPNEYARPEVQFAKQAAKEAAEQAVDSVRELLGKIEDIASGEA